MFVSITIPSAVIKGNLISRCRFDVLEFRELFACSLLVQSLGRAGWGAVWSCIRTGYSCSRHGVLGS